MRCHTAQGDWAEYVECPGCGLQALDPMPDAEAILGFYGRDYYGVGATKFVGGIDEVRNLFIARRARALMRRLSGRPRPRILDIGCGSGTFVRYMGRLGAEIHATELPGAAYERAKSVPGLRLVAGDLSDEAFAPGSFDAITLWHVFEHIRDPDALVRRCRRLLAPQGILIVEVPNRESWQARWTGGAWLHLDPPRHVYQYTRRALAALFERHGLQWEEPIRTAAFEMGAVGILQSLLNRWVEPRDLLYTILHTRNRCPGAALWKGVSVLLGLLLGPPAAAWAVVEAMAGRGVILRCVCRLRDPG